MPREHQIYGNMLMHFHQTHNLCMSHSQYQLIILQSSEQNNYLIIAERQPWTRVELMCANSCTLISNDPDLGYNYICQNSVVLPWQFHVHTTEGVMKSTSFTILILKNTLTTHIDLEPWATKLCKSGQMPSNFSNVKFSVDFRNGNTTNTKITENFNFS